MADFRPLLFANALMLMLLVSAGFASLQPELQDLTKPSWTDQGAAPPPLTTTEQLQLESNAASVQKRLHPANPERRAISLTGEAPEWLVDTQYELMTEHASQVLAPTHTPGMESYLESRLEKLKDDIAAALTLRLSGELAEMQRELIFRSPGFNREEWMSSRTTLPRYRL